MTRKQFGFCSGKSDVFLAIVKLWPYELLPGVSYVFPKIEIPILFPLKMKSLVFEIPKIVVTQRILVRVVFKGSTKIL